VHCRIVTGGLSTFQQICPTISKQQNSKMNGNCSCIFGLVLESDTLFSKFKLKTYKKTFLILNNWKLPFLLLLIKANFYFCLKWSFGKKNFLFLYLLNQFSLLVFYCLDVQSVQISYLRYENRHRFWNLEHPFKILVKSLFLALCTIIFFLKAPHIYVES